MISRFTFGMLRKLKIHEKKEDTVLPPREEDEITVDTGGGIIVTGKPELIVSFMESMIKMSQGGQQ